jgi:hypothetical protein
MKISRKQAWSVAILIAIAATTMSMRSSQARNFCPQYLAKYCVVNKDGTRQTEWTNPCFAKARGQRVLHLGACQGPICPFVPFVYLPVCSLNPYTNKPETYGNQCLSDVGNATLLHKGACK